MPLKLIREHFPSLSELQLDQLKKFGEIITEWNDMINVISRKDIENIYDHHILHSLIISKVFKFNDDGSILDLGTGGGFPGIPLAILFPNTKFHLIDARAKKIKVVQDAIDRLGLKNVTAEHKRAEELKSTYDFVVTRAVAKLDTLKLWTSKLIHEKESHAIPNGIIALKGGNIKELKKELPTFEYIEEYPISDWIESEYFEEKYIIYVQA